MRKHVLSDLWTEERGVSLIETLAAVMIVATVVTGSIGVLGAATRASGKVETGAGLQQVARSQIEAIQQSPFQNNPANYPAITGLPDGVSVTISVTDPGTSYRYPDPDNSSLTGVVQQVEVTAVESDTVETLVFYKIRTP